MNPRYRIHLRRMGIALVILLGVLLIFNLLVDPYAAFALLPHGGLHPYAAGTGTRIGKARMIARGDWDVLLLGTSRVQLSLDPAHPAFSGMKVYNAGLYGGDFPELDRAARLAMSKGKLRRLILCVDLYCFDAAWRPPPESQQSLLNASLNPVDYRLANVLSISATELSFKTVSNWIHHQEDGSYPLGLLRIDVADRRHHRVDWTVGGFFSLTVPPAAEKSEHWTLSPSRLDALAELLNEASRRNVQVDLVQLPMHAMSLERYFAVNRWPLYEQWVTALTHIAARHNRQFPDHLIPFWDFAGYNSYNTAPAVEESQWYFDPFHFNVDLGNLVLDRILPFPAPAGERLDHFGMIVTEENLQSHLATLRKDHEAYYAANPELRQIYQAIQADRAAPSADEDLPPRGL